MCNLWPKFQFTDHFGTQKRKKKQINSNWIDWSLNLKCEQVVWAATTIYRVVAKLFTHTYVAHEKCWRLHFPTLHFSWHVLDPLNQLEGKVNANKHKAIISDSSVITITAWELMNMIATQPGTHSGLCGSTWNSSTKHQTITSLWKLLEQVSRHLSNQSQKAVLGGS